MSNFRFRYANPVIYKFWLSNYLLQIHFLYEYLLYAFYTFYYETTNSHFHINLDRYVYYSKWLVKVHKWVLGIVGKVNHK